MTDKEKVRILGKQIGFGNMMHLTSKCWRESLQKIGLAGGEFVSGPCKSQVVSCICKSDERGYCKLCCGCGWLTKEVKRVLSEK